MKFARMITTIDGHTGGEPMRVVTGGVPGIPGATMLEKMDYCRKNWDSLRTFLIHEPRGHKDMYACLLTEPSANGADFGVVWLGQGGYDPMCGHGTIVLSTVLVETGMVEASEPQTTIVLDTPAGVVRACVYVKGGSARSVTFQNVPSFLYREDVELDVVGLGAVKVDVAYGGDLFFAILPAETVGLRIEPSEVRAIISRGIQVWRAASEQVKAWHPEEPSLEGFSGVIFSAAATNPEATLKNVFVAPPGAVDRCPDGTGTSARMATLFAKGELGLNEEFVHESILGSLFHGKLIAETTVGSYRAVIPTVTGSASITGIHQFVLDGEDPFPGGFYLG